MTQRNTYTDGVRLGISIGQSVWVFRQCLIKPAPLPQLQSQHIWSSVCWKDILGWQYVLGTVSAWYTHRTTQLVPFAIESSDLRCNVRCLVERRLSGWLRFGCYSAVTFNTLPAASSDPSLSVREENYSHTLLSLRWCGSRRFEEVWCAHL